MRRDSLPFSPHGGAGPPERPRRSPLWGYLEVLLAASLWGSSGIFATHLFRLGVTPESVALLRPLIGLGFLAAAALAWRRRLPRLTGRGVLLLLGVGGVATAAFQISYQMSTEAAGVPVTVALLYLAPAMVLAGAGPLLGEWPTRARVGLALLSVAGVWLAVFNARGATPTLTPPGVAWGLLAGACYAGYTLFGRLAAPVWGSMATVLYSTAGACVFLLLGLSVAGRPLAPPPGLGGWALLVAFALLTIAAATFLFYDALGRIEAGPASVASTIEPVVAALLATWLLGQGLTAWGWVGITLVVVGVAGSYWTAAERQSLSTVHE